MSFNVFLLFKNSDIVFIIFVVFYSTCRLHISYVNLLMSLSWQSFLQSVIVFHFLSFSSSCLFTLLTSYDIFFCSETFLTRNFHWCENSKLFLYLSWDTLTFLADILFRKICTAFPLSLFSLQLKRYLRKVILGEVILVLKLRKYVSTFF